MQKCMPVHQGNIPGQEDLLRWPYFEHVKITEIEGVFTPIVRLLWSETVDELADSVRFLLAWFDFTHAKYQANQILSTKSHVKAVAHSLVTNHMGFEGRDKG